MVAQQVQLGLTCEDGLKAQLRASAHDLERQLNQASQTEWLLQLLTKIH